MISHIQNGRIMLGQRGKGHSLALPMDQKGLTAQNNIRKVQPKYSHYLES